MNSFGPCGHRVRRCVHVPLSPWPPLPHITTPHPTPHHPSLSHSREQARPGHRPLVTFFMVDFNPSVLGRGTLQVTNHGRLVSGVIRTHRCSFILNVRFVDQIFNVSSGTFCVWLTIDNDFYLTRWSVHCLFLCCLTPNEESTAPK